MKRAKTMAVVTMFGPGETRNRSWGTGNELLGRQD